MDIYNEVLFRHKEEIPPFTTTWLKLEHIILSKKSQTWKDKYCIILLICEV